eukprot:6071741-Alexandrium_andersonii.AAC.1
MERCCHGDDSSCARAQVGVGDGVLVQTYSAKLMLCMRMVEGVPGARKVGPEDRRIRIIRFDDAMLERNRCP